MSLGLFNAMIAAERAEAMRLKEQACLDGMIRGRDVFIPAGTGKPILIHPGERIRTPGEYIETSKKYWEMMEALNAAGYGKVKTAQPSVFDR